MPGDRRLGAGLWLAHRAASPCPALGEGARENFIASGRTMSAQDERQRFRSPDCASGASAGCELVQPEICRAERPKPAEPVLPGG